MKNFGYKSFVMVNTLKLFGVFKNNILLKKFKIHAKKKIFNFFAIKNITCTWKF